MKKTLLIVFAVLAGCIGYACPPAVIANGIWRGVLQRNDGIGIPFNFMVTDSAGKKLIYIINASNRLKVDDIYREGDSIIIRLPFFDSEFRVVNINNSELRGRWIEHVGNRDNVIPFVAVHNENYRFIIRDKIFSSNISGRWSVNFRDSVTGKSFPGVGVFEQKGNHVTGSFLTGSGDYRFLEGVIDGDSLKLSGFDGGYAQCFLAKINNSNTITAGRLFSGAGSATKVWTASRDDNANLNQKPGNELINSDTSPKIEFTFKEANGNKISFKDKKFKNKIVIIQIMGSWCPNCLDETVFVNQLYKEYKSKGVEVLGLAYERTADFTRSAIAVRNFIQRLAIPYPVLIAPVAVSDPLRVEKTFPQLKKIIAFPTTVFVGRDGTIKDIHTGFNGPGTGEDYEKQKEVFYSIINRLLEEK